MSREVFVSILIGLFVCAVLCVFAPPAQAGPELVCWPFDIGNARSLPWGGTGWHDASPDYVTSHLAADTLALLAPDAPVLVRMETLRRAAIYAQKDPQAAQELFARLTSRTQVSGKPDALALFDLGYLTEAYRQAGLGRAVPDFAATQNGYVLVGRALEARGADPQMEFAAALLASVTGQRGAASQHLAKSAAGATGGSLLAKNLVTHCHLLRVQAASLAELRKQLVAEKN
jgi:hypothetical protein